MEPENTNENETAQVENNQNDTVPETPVEAVVDAPAEEVSQTGEEKMVEDELTS